VRHWAIAGQRVHTAFTVAIRLDLAFSCSRSGGTNQEPFVPLTASCAEMDQQWIAKTSDGCK